MSKWFSDLGSSIGKFFEDLWKNLGNSLNDLWKGVCDIFGWLGNFFNALLDFFIHVFVPTEEQWSAIKQDYKELGENFNNHLPFVGFFSDELEKAKQIVYNEDFLNLKFEGWNFDLGVVKFSTPDVNFTGVLNAYEKFRMSVRTMLTFVVYILALVYIVKYVLRYGETGGNTNVIQGQTSLFDKK